MAMAEKHLAAIYNRSGFDVIDHYTYGMCGDGDLMEGVSHEAASLAGTLGLGKLIFLYDDNHISLDGPTDLSFTEDVLERFEAYHWHVQRVADGNDLDGISKAIEAAQAVKDKPSLIAARTIIGYGSPKAGTSKAHGEALGAEAVKATKKFFDWPEDKTFYVPDEAAKNWLQAVDKGAKEESDWNAVFASYRKSFPELAAEYARAGGAPEGRVGAESAAIPRGRQAGGDAHRWQHSHERFREVCSRAAGWCGGSFHVDENGDQKQRQFPSRSDRTEHLFRRARVRHVRDRKWNGYARRHHSVRLDVLQLFGLREARDTAGRDHAVAFHFRFHTRFHRPRGGRTDASARRAAHHAARHSPPHGFPSCRC
jgi:transketolase